MKSDLKAGVSAMSGVRRDLCLARALHELLLNAK